MATLGPYELDTVVCGDCLDVMARMPDNCVDTVITDPPYGLKFMGKDWDKGVPGKRYWKAVLRVAKPGATLLAFGGTRTHHRLMCAIEDAGWEIRDCMMYLYGAGFPKPLDVGKAIDKAAGAKREVVSRERKKAFGYEDRPWKHREDANVNIVTAPATEAACLWDGWGTALKPAWEPIIVAMKPREGTFAENALKWGVAGMWIDGTRIGTADTRAPAYRMTSKAIPGGGYGTGQMDYTRDGSTAGSPCGRWPANLILSHSEGCVQVGTKRVQPAGGDIAADSKGSGPRQNAVYGKDERERGAWQAYKDPDGLETVADWDCVEGCAVRMLGEQSGERCTPATYTRNITGHSSPNPMDRAAHKLDTRQIASGYGDTGTAARFFYCAKAARRERWFYCQDCQEAFPRKVRDDHGHGHVDDKGKQTWDHIVQHPTQKPLAVMEYLCKLTMTPTGGIVFDPFLGSGSTAVAARALGRHYFGIELNPEYVEMSEKRLAKITGIQLRLLE